MLSSQNFAALIQQLETSGAISRDNTLLLYGDQAYGSSIPFYLDRPLSHPALLVDGRSPSSMLFGGTFPDAQGLFLTPALLNSVPSGAPARANSSSSRSNTATTSTASSARARSSSKRPPAKPSSPIAPSIPSGTLAWTQPHNSTASLPASNNGSTSP